MRQHAIPAALFAFVFTLLTGILYPLVITGLGDILFPAQASGSLLNEKGRTIGSELIGQPFSDPRYFWGRPSATTPFPYNAAHSGGSNLGPTNPALISAVQARIQALHAADPDNTAPIPVDLVTSSASGLDPHISPAAAFYQVRRVAKVRGLDEKRVRALVECHVQGRQFGFLGEPVVNVLELNLALDALARSTPLAP